MQLLIPPSGSQMQTRKVISSIGPNINLNPNATLTNTYKRNHS